MDQPGDDYKAIAHQKPLVNGALAPGEAIPLTLDVNAEVDETHDKNSVIPTDLFRHLRFAGQI